MFRGIIHNDGSSRRYPDRVLSWCVETLRSKWYILPQWVWPPRVLRLEHLPAQYSIHSTPPHDGSYLCSFGKIIVPWWRGLSIYGIEILLCVLYLVIYICKFIVVLCIICIYLLYVCVCIFCVGRLCLGYSISIIIVKYVPIRRPSIGPVCVIHSLRLFSPLCL